MRVLILGGTAEGRAVAAQLTEQDIPVITSYAGRVKKPVIPQGELRIGGFGGLYGLINFIVTEEITHVVCAVHPYAVQMRNHAIMATLTLGMPLYCINRPGWKPFPGDQWHHVSTVWEAFDVVKQLGTHVYHGAQVFNTLGRSSLPYCAADELNHYLIRLVEEPEPHEELPAQHELILDRGPYDAKSEIKLMQEHQIDLVISKNSGGSYTYAKIEAARHLQIPVVMVDRPETGEFTHVHWFADPAALTEAVTAQTLLKTPVTGEQSNAPQTPPAWWQEVTIAAEPPQPEQLYDEKMVPRLPWQALGMEPPTSCYDLARWLFTVRHRLPEVDDDATAAEVELLKLAGQWGGEDDATATTLQLRQLVASQFWRAKHGLPLYGIDEPVPADLGFRPGTEPYAPGSLLDELVSNYRLNQGLTGKDDAAAIVAAAVAAQPAHAGTALDAAELEFDRLYGQSDASD